MYRHTISLLAAFAATLVLAPVSATLCYAASNDGVDPSVIDEVSASVHQVPLTEDMINRLVESYPAMRAAGAKSGGTELPEQLPAAGNGASDVDALPAEKRKELEAVATKYGFKNLDEWSDVASSVVMSYAYAMQGKKPGAIEDTIKHNIEQAESDPQMTPEQKQETVAKYNEIGAKLARLEPLKENYDLVVRMKDKVTSILDAN